MKDNYGREIKYMRISVTDLCNNRCMYCMPEAGICKKEHTHILSFEDIEKVVRAAVSLGITKFRLTGGEPLVRKGIVGLVEKLSAIEGVTDLAMTTNGALLGKYAADLKKAGLNRVNISLDTFFSQKYEYITRGGNIDDVMDGIEAARIADLSPVRINVVVMKGFNDDEIINFAQLTLNDPIDVRFIEYMPIATSSLDFPFEPMSNMQIMSKLQGLIEVPEKGSVAKYYKWEQALGKIGFISAMSSHFCSECNKIRLTSDGKLKPCLHSNQEIDLVKVLREGTTEELKMEIAQAIIKKEKEHRLNDGADPITREMNRIGG